MKNNPQLPSRYTALVQGRPKSDGESTSKVNFETVTIFEFPVEIGDNPACREGCPIQLGHRLLSRSTMGVDSYEEARGDRPPAKDLCMGVSDRAAMLLSKGYALDEIVAAVMEVEIVKKSRAESLRLSNREKLSVVIDSAGRTLRKIVGNSKREEPHTVQARMA